MLPIYNMGELDQATRAQRATQVREMIPGYEVPEPEKNGFDYGVNYHGRTHATRAFILGTVMANILQEKGATLDMNAVAFGIAGHDTGRTGNGADTEASEQASAANTAPTTIEQSDNSKEPNKTAPAAIAAKATVVVAT